MRWREKAGGADFHARYLVTDRGIRVDVGFSAEGRHQKTDMAIIDFALSVAKIAALGLWLTRDVSGFCSA
jgi:hypothetical protein